MTGARGGVRYRAVLTSSVVLVGVLAAASVAAWMAVANVQARFDEVVRARALLVSFEDVQRSVSAMAFAEAAYRRSPSEERRAAVVAALAAVPARLDVVLAADDARGRAVAEQVRVLHRRYAAEVEAGLGVGSALAGTTVDDRVAGPALAAMQTLADGAIKGHRAEVAAANESQRQTLRGLAFAVPLVMLSALTVIVSCLGFILRQHRRMSVRARESEWASTHDPLTGVANRVLMWRAIDLALEEPSPDFALLLVDLDRFKAVNDDHGHAVGDQVLVTTARRLEQHVGAGELVARLGGDEFAVLVRPASRTDEVAARLREALPQPIAVDGPVAVACGASIGVAVAAAGLDRVALLRRADLDMYQGKPRRRQVPRAREGSPAVPDPPRTTVLP